MPLTLPFGAFSFSKKKNSPTTPWSASPPLARVGRARGGGSDPPSASPVVLGGGGLTPQCEAAVLWGGVFACPCAPPYSSSCSDPASLACSPHASRRSFVGRPCVRVRACVRASRRNMQRNALQVGRKDGAAEALPRRMRRQCKEVGDRASGSLCHEGVRGGGPAPADRARRARRASARPLVVRALPAGAGPRSERAARAGRRTGRTKRRQTPNEERRANAASNSNLQLLQTTAPKCEEDDVHVDATKFGSTRPPRVVRIKPESIGRVFAPPIGASSHRSNAGSFRSPRRSARSVTPL